MTTRSPHDPLDTESIAKMLADPELSASLRVLLAKTFQYRYYLNFRWLGRPIVQYPQDVVALAGTRQAVEYSTHLEAHQATGAGSARLQHQYKIDPNRVRALAPGTAYVISRGRAAKAQMARAPELTARLPEAGVPVATGPSEEGSGPVRPEVPY